MKKKLAVATVETAVKPPPTKREVIVATAIAVVEKVKAQQEALLAEHAKLTEQFNAGFAARFREFVSGGGEIGFCRAAPSMEGEFGTLEARVTAEVTIGDDLQGIYARAESIEKDLRKIRILSVEEVIRDLSKAENSDRVRAILDVPGLSDQLAKAGMKALGKAELLRDSVTV